MIILFLVTIIALLIYYIFGQNQKGTQEIQKSNELKEKELELNPKYLKIKEVEEVLENQDQEYRAELEELNEIVNSSSDQEKIRKAEQKREKLIEEWNSWSTPHSILAEKLDQLKKGKLNKFEMDNIFLLSSVNLDNIHELEDSDKEIIMDNRNRQSTLTSKNLLKQFDSTYREEKESLYKEEITMMKNRYLKYLELHKDQSISKQFDIAVALFKYLNTFDNFVRFWQFSPKDKIKWQKEHGAAKKILERLMDIKEI